MYFENLLGTNRIPSGTKITQREAVRGVVIKDENMVFMIHTANGDYKFPGGGIEDGENHVTALIREFIEETGYSISNMIQLIGVIIEQKQDAYEPEAYFVMKSYYYRCGIIGEKQEQKLDAYEKEMDFKAEYVSIIEAYKQNKRLLEVNCEKVNPWVSRELIALKNIIERFDIRV
jgi:8-oxo-dGTP pyrophosphatase MutT (NUDIX family)